MAMMPHNDNSEIGHPYAFRMDAIERTLVLRFQGSGNEPILDQYDGTWSVDIGGLNINLTELAVEINEAIPYQNQHKDSR